MNYIVDICGDFVDEWIVWCHRPSPVLATRVRNKDESTSIKLVILAAGLYSFKSVEGLQSKTSTIFWMPHAFGMGFYRIPGLLNLVEDIRVGGDCLGQCKRGQFLLSLDFCWRQIEPPCTSLPLTQNPGQPGRQDTLCIGEEALLIYETLEGGKLTFLGGSQSLCSYATLRFA